MVTVCVAVLFWDGARNTQVHSINLGLNFDVSSQTNQNSQPTHKNVNTRKKQIPQTRRESHPRNLWLNVLESPFCGKMEARMHEDQGHFGEPKVPNTLFGFILPDSVTLFLLVLQYFVMFAANYSYLCIAYCVL